MAFLYVSSVGSIIVGSSLILVVILVFTEKLFFRNLAILVQFYLKNLDFCSKCFDFLQKTRILFVSSKIQLYKPYSICFFFKLFFSRLTAVKAESIYRVGLSYVRLYKLAISITILSQPLRSFQFST